MIKLNENRRKGIQVDYVVVEDVKFYPLYSGRQWFVSECGKILGSKGKVLGTQDNGNGYKLVKFQDADKRIRNKYVHRLVAEVFWDEPSWKSVNHKDGDKSNNAMSNLEYVTAKENTAHAIQTGLTTNIPKKGQQGFQKNDKAPKN